ncbi:ATP-dependent helicase [Nocardioides sp.]|uniref:ATP-dependent helicase n=1 Tax=Nocardioides sp. TaxID=35761 RepID=UPI0035160FF4
MRSVTAPTYRLAPPPPTVAAPVLDEHQRAVVEHRDGPLLVLAGPGTGKTTTLVEAIADRLEQPGVTPDSVLALTFSRKAAEQLRDRVTARVGRTLGSGLSATFHSFAYGLVRQYAPAEIYAAPLRLLSAPEQDVVLRELLTDHPESVRWPEGLRRALGTRGFAREVNAVLSRAREKGLDGDELIALAEREDQPELRAAGLFLEQYLDTLDSLGATDYPDLIRRAAIEAADHRAELRARYRYVFVDEYQDTDPGQIALLRHLAGDGGNLVVVGDPHQSIYAFRGAEVRGILDFPRQFPERSGAPAPVIALRTTRRFGPRLLAASQRIAGRIGLPGSIPPAARAAFLDPVAQAAVPGRAQVLTFDTERAEAEHLADVLRRAHLEDGLDWSEMAVLVRSGRSTLPPLRRALVAAGVPVEVAADELPLVRDPAVLPLLEALRAVVNLDNDDPEHPDHLDPGRVEQLLLSPLGGLDAGDLRRLARRVRQRAKERGAAAVPPGPEAPETPEGPEGAERVETPLLAPSRVLVRDAVLHPGVLRELLGAAVAPPEDLREDLPPEAAASGTARDRIAEGPRELVRALALHDLLQRARADLDAGASGEQVLWTLWSGTPWPERLRRAAESGGPAARRAHRDLDAVVALFDAVARAEEQRVHVSVPHLLANLAAQQIPADSLAERGTRGVGVRLLTAHRSKGLEWRLVVVAHVQADAWPDLRRRATLLQADRLGPDGLVPPTTVRELLVEERRLFYVACTRARERLLVTAVASPDDDGEQPSRFLDELGLPVDHRVGRPQRPLSVAGLVADLRRTVTDPEAPSELRRAAAHRLALLARVEVGDRRPFAAADPGTWWGLRDRTRASVPLRPAEAPIPLSASSLDGLTTCPARWFFSREAGGEARHHQAANLGQLVHALAERVASGALDADAEDVEALLVHVDEVWDRMEFRTPWAKDREYERTRRALARFLRWHHRATRTLVAVEQPFRTTLRLPDPEQPDAPVTVLLTGVADRVELDAGGRLVVVDLKTGREKPSDKAVESHQQLGFYQLAADTGAFADVPGVPGVADGGVSGGAELVQLGLRDDAADAVVQRQSATGADDPRRRQLEEQIRAAAGLLRREQLPARPGDHCRTCPFTALCPAMSVGAVTGP